MGKDGYLQQCKEIVGCRVKIQNAIEQIPELYIIGNPVSSVVAFSAHEPVGIFGVLDEMKKRGWDLSPLQYPAALHLACTRLTVPVADEFIRDLTDSVATVKASPDSYKKGSQALYGFASTVPDSSLVDEIAYRFIDTLYKA
ncbi:Dihydrosphingosine phosphate lyase [Linderina pennispora]|nr:Dihydrosphingosine phosphate lyase [Linderina pennispora]